MTKVILGIDIGGSGIKGNLVDTETGALVDDRFKVATPQPARPEAIAEVVAKVVDHFGYSGPVGCTFPAIIKRGVAYSAANVHPDWIGTDADALFERRTGLPFTVMNDADAAGVAEVAYGAAAGRDGVVLVLTFGTGVGSGMFLHGRLVPNTEFGHLELSGHAPVERWCAARVKVEENLSWAQWGGRMNTYLGHLVRLFSPDLFVIGGGISREFERFSPYLTPGIETVPAKLQNQAGIVGAALHAVSDRFGSRP